MKNYQWPLLGLVLLGPLNACAISPPKTPSVQTRDAVIPSFLPSPSPAVTGAAVTAVAESVSCIDLVQNTQTTQTAEVDLWPWGAKAAVSFTLDEGVLEPYTILLPEFDVRGWKASFFIYTDQPQWEKTWSVILQAHQRGHEVTNHTKTHPNLTTLSDEQIHEELKLGIAELKKQLKDDSLVFPSFAYPYEATDERTWKIVKQYHRYARSGDNGALVPPNPVPINDAHHPKWNALTAKAVTHDYSLEAWNSWIDATVKQGGWFIEELHGVEHQGNVGGWEPRSLREFQDHFDHIESFGQDIWVDSMGAVSKYIEERESAQVKVNFWSSEGITVDLKDDFKDEALFNVPLTLKLELPTAWDINKIIAVQGGETLEIQAAESGSFRVSAWPNGEPICILPSAL